MCSVPAKSPAALNKASPTKATVGATVNGPINLNKKPTAPVNPINT